MLKALVRRQVASWFAIASAAMAWASSVSVGSGRFPVTPQGQRVDLAGKPIIQCSIALRGLADPDSDYFDMGVLARDGGNLNPDGSIDHEMSLPRD